MCICLYMYDDDDDDGCTVMNEEDHRLPLPMQSASDACA